MAELLTIGVPREADPNEKRVALVPAGVSALKKLGVEVQIQKGAGLAAGFPDQQYSDKGATVVESRDEVFRNAGIVLQVRSLGACGDDGGIDIPRLRDGQTLIASCDPLTCPGRIAEVAQQKARVFSLELVPRITRAQSMDILSSMATIAGYRAVLLAATASPRMFPMMMTAAGTLKPARVLVIGAGVAGLQAIATARRLGAQVLGYDIRPAVKEQVESLGARFVELNVAAQDAESKGGYAKEMSADFYRKQQEELKAVIAQCDVVITTAAIPGKKAPILITRDMAEALAPGSVIVDIAAERGGNCELTVPGQQIEHHGITILGPVNLPSDIPTHASEMFSRNVITFLAPMIRDGQLVPDRDDEIIRDTLLTEGGEVVHPRIQELLKA
ncbi:MAG: Re/Si-specific NAD(P)(+) transhydrogenase subunit alpha [Planctomycetaceae bacterium]|nr:Re/Si-specific NAD(P)(+) transhydrogenase subunit alpha [Planctomycetaceae bacterium]